MIQLLILDENIDEKITAQQQEIEKQVNKNFYLNKEYIWNKELVFKFKIAQEQPLISIRYNLNTILDEYQNDDIIYRKKIEVNLF